MKHYITLIFLCLSLSSCASIKDKMKPLKLVFDHKPAGPFEYEQGWDDGCESGLSVKPNDYYRTFYRYKQQNNLLHNPYYYRAWKTSFDYCRAYAYGMLKEAGMRNSQPHDPIHQQGILNIMGNWGPGITARW